MDEHISRSAESVTHPEPKASPRTRPWILAGLVAMCFAMSLPNGYGEAGMTEASSSTASSQKSKHCAFPGHGWSPMSQGQRSQWDQQKLAAAQQYADQIHSSAVMIVECGRVVSEWGDPAKKITSFSVSQKFHQRSLRNLLGRRCHRRQPDPGAGRDRRFTLSLDDRRATGTHR